MPGGNVIAKVRGSPSFLAASTKGLRALGSAPTLPFHSDLRVMAWPLRLTIHGMIIGFFGEPRRPIEEARGMPVSMWVAWLSPLERASRMAAQLAPLVMVALIPYFLKKPFSWAMTKGEQSVRAMMPILTLGISGPSPGLAAVAAQERGPRAEKSAAAPVRPAVRVRNWRRLSEVTAVEDDDPARVSGGVSFMGVRMEGECCAMEIFAKEAAG